VILLYIHQIKDEDTCEKQSKVKEFVDLVKSLFRAAVMLENVLGHLIGQY
jgi:hypothetical protein